jgi:hypothetical protein
MEAGGELEHAAFEHSAVDSRQVFENLLRAVISRRIAYSNFTQDNIA